MSDPGPAGRRPRNRFERWLFSFMGPASVGDVHAPSSYVVPQSAAVCRKCGRPWEEHTVIRPDGKTLAQCPAV